MIPMVDSLGAALGEEAVRVVWQALALGSCLGGNGTLVGASANVVSAGIAGRSSYKITFMEFTKYGFAFMIISLAVSTVYTILFLL